MRKLATIVASVTLATGALLTQSSLPAGALDNPVDIRVEHDLIPGDSGPRVLEVTGVTAGAGPEITVADEVDNPSDWGGNVLVDIDPDAQTITVEVEDQNCYDIVQVEITTDEIASIQTVSDELWDPDPATNPVIPALSTSVSGGVVTLVWNTDGTDCPDLNAVGSQAVFTYAEVAVLAPTASLAPSSVQAGTPVVVTGTGCTNSPVLATIGPEGGTPTVNDVEQVIGAADGTWSFEIDTTGLAAGTYSVATRCVLADGAGFSYDPLTFAVTVQPQPAQPAAPVPAAPAFTG